MIQFEVESKWWVIIGSIWVAASILIGAVGKHVLKAGGDFERAEYLNTSSTYGMVVGLSLIVLSSMRWMRFWYNMAPWPERFLGLGLFLFSGGLWLRALAPGTIISELLSPCIPFGGMLLTAGFIWLSIQTIKVLFVKNGPE